MKCFLWIEMSDVFKEIQTYSYRSLMMHQVIHHQVPGSAEQNSGVFSGSPSLGNIKIKAEFQEFLLLG